MLFKGLSNSSPLGPSYFRPHPVKTAIINTKNSINVYIEPFATVDGGNPLRADPINTNTLRNGILCGIPCAKPSRRFALL